MKYSISNLKILRNKTKSSLNLCKIALQETNDNVVEAEKFILKKINENIKFIQFKTNESYEKALKALYEYGSIEKAIKYLSYKKYFFYNLILNDLNSLKLGLDKTDLIIKNSNLSYDCLVKIGEFKNLNSLEIIDCTIEEEGFVFIENLKELNILKLIYTNITRKGLKSISKLNVSHLEIIYGKLKSMDLVLLRYMYTLEHLELSDLNIDSHIIKYFANLKLSYLEFWNCEISNDIKNKLKRILPKNCIINTIGEWFNE